jgi:hypothetical protein
MEEEKQHRGRGFRIMQALCAPNAARFASQIPKYGILLPISLNYGIPLGILHTISRKNYHVQDVSSQMPYHFPRMPKPFTLRNANLENGILSTPTISLFEQLFQITLSLFILIFLFQNLHFYKS